MSAIVKGWCPDAYRPMQSGDGWILRIKPWMCQVSKEHLLILASLAKDFGLGYVDLTSRANIQIRGVKEDAIDKVLERLIEVELVGDKVSEPRRNILISHDADERSETLYLELAKRLHEFPKLPSKFGYAIDLGSKRVLTNASADIRFESDRHGQMLLRADGVKLGIHIDLSNAVDEAIGLAHWFVSQSNGLGRMRDFAAELPATLQIVEPVESTETPLGKNHIAPIFGHVSAEELRILADVAPVFITPLRSVITHSTAPLDWIKSDDDPRRNIVICAGAPHCEQAFQNTNKLARAIGSQLHTTQDIHISGCAKSCASQAPHQWAFIGQSDGFDVYENGVHRGVQQAGKILEMMKESHAL